MKPRFAALLFLTLTFFFSSCLKIPKAQFTVEPASPHAGEVVVFLNQSTDALRFDWDFGNNKGSQEAEPTTTYDKPGFYTIQLTARNGLRANVKTVGIEVIP